MERDARAAAHLGGNVMKLDKTTDMATSIADHRPREFCDLAGTQSGFDAEQNDDAITRGVAIAPNRSQSRVDVRVGQNFHFFSSHLSLSCGLRRHGSLYRITVLSSREICYITTAYGIL